MNKGVIKEYLSVQNRSIKTREKASSKNVYLDLIKWWFDNIHSQNEDMCVENIIDYTDTLERFYTAFKQISKYNGNDKLENSLDKLLIMGRVANFYPLIIAVWDRWMDETDDIKMQEIKKLIDLIEIAAFRIYAIGGKRSDTGRSNLRKVVFPPINSCKGLGCL